MKRYLLSGLALLLASTSAQAQGMSRYGMWDEEHKSSQREWNVEIFPDNTSPPVYSGNIRTEVLPVEPQVIQVIHEEEAGTIVINSAERKLYYILDADEAFVYPISVGREGFAWTGVEKVSRIQDWPDWTPPKEMLQRRPDLPTFMAGGLKNPLGAKAIYLGNTLYRIHGTNDPKSIGRAESSGCIRMLNEHVVHLAQYVEIGTIVKVH